MVYNKKYKKKYNKKYKRYRAPSTALLGNKRLVKLKYHEQLQMNPGIAGIPATYVFSANGCYDPNITGAGHQPRGFDQMMSLYNHYTVIKSKIIVTWMKGGSQTTSVITAISLRDSNTVESSMQDYIESRNTTYGPLAGAGNATKVLKKNFSAKNFLGRPHPLSEDDLRGNAVNNPVEEAYFHLVVAPTYGVDTAAVDLNVLIEYIVMLTEPKNPPSS